MLNIAIDGPSGAGKSTIAKMLAKKLDILYLDTGAMYRAVAYRANMLGIDVNDVEKIKAFIENIEMDIQYTEDKTQHIIIDGIDVTNYIREHHISKMASDVSKIPEVRIKLVNEQRRIASFTDLVLDGRDITSYVLPDAKYKFFLTASDSVRAMRRYKELMLKNIDITYDEVLKDIIDRDYNDSHRAFAPLTKTEDSTLIDTTDMTIDEVADKIMSLIKK